MENINVASLLLTVPGNSDLNIISTDNDNNENNQFNPDKIKYYPIVEPPGQSMALTLYEYILKKHPPTWSKFFLSAELEIRHACEMINKTSIKTGKSILPIMTDVLAAFWICPLFLLKGVVIGQDPYPGFTKNGMPKACGVSFACRKEYPMPASLKYVYKELERSVEDWKDPGHPDIRCWGKQGVLLLNSALTTEAKSAGAHLGFWKPFTSKLMDFMNENCKNLVFMLWGKKAEKVAESVFTTKHLKLTAYHPSPMSLNSGYSFGGCNHFNLANEYLISKDVSAIDWRVK